MLFQTSEPPLLENSVLWKDGINEVNLRGLQAEVQHRDSDLTISVPTRNRFESVFATEPSCWDGVS